VLVAGLGSVPLEAEFAPTRGLLLPGFSVILHPRLYSIGGVGVFQPRG